MVKDKAHSNKSDSQEAKAKQEPAAQIEQQPAQQQAMEHLTESFGGGEGEAVSLLGDFQESLKFLTKSATTEQSIASMAIAEGKEPDEAIANYIQKNIGDHSFYNEQIFMV